VQVSGNRLVAIVGGDISFTNDPVLGPITRDYGGRLFSVDLTSGQEVDITMPGRLHRYPALSPSGQRLVVESYVDLGGSRPLPSADLWALEEP
jgi:Tol biopolymer transport system component